MAVKLDGRTFRWYGIVGNREWRAKLEKRAIGVLINVL
jgi:hypothetical protein